MVKHGFKVLVSTLEAGHNCSISLLAENFHLPNVQKIHITNAPYGNLCGIIHFSAYLRMSRPGSGSMRWKKCNFISDY